jgi:large subunit ribosomal protein L17
VALFRHGRIETTLAKAKALRPFSEKIITLAKKAQAAEVSADRIHFRRMAVSRVHDEDAIKRLFTERVSEFVNRNGGYTRIYKLVPRRGDAAKMAIIELVAGEDKGYKKSRRAVKAKRVDAPVATATVPPAEENGDVLVIDTSLLVAPSVPESTEENAATSA